MTMLSFLCGAKSAGKRSSHAYHSDACVRRTSMGSAACTSGRACDDTGSEAASHELPHEFGSLSATLPKPSTNKACGQAVHSPSQHRPAQHSASLSPPSAASPPPAPRAPSPPHTTASPSGAGSRASDADCDSAMLLSDEDSSPRAVSAAELRAAPRPVCAARSAAHAPPPASKCGGGKCPSAAGAGLGLARLSSSSAPAGPGLARLSGSCGAGGGARRGMGSRTSSQSVMKLEAMSEDAVIPDCMEHLQVLSEQFNEVRVAAMKALSEMSTSALVTEDNLNQIIEDMDDTPCNRMVSLEGLDDWNSQAVLRT